MAMLFYDAADDGRQEPARVSRRAPRKPMCRNEAYV